MYARTYVKKSKTSATIMTLTSSGSVEIVALVKSSLGKR